jgi:hypothetical protein
MRTGESPHRLRAGFTLGVSIAPNGTKVATHRIANCREQLAVLAAFYWRCRRPSVIFSQEYNNQCLNSCNGQKTPRISLVDAGSAHFKTSFMSNKRQKTLAKKNPKEGSSFSDNLLANNEEPKSECHRDEMILGVVLTEEIIGFGSEYDNDDDGAQGRIREELEEVIRLHRKQGKLLRHGNPNDRKIISEAIFCRSNYAGHGKWIHGLIESGYRDQVRMNDYNFCRALNIKRLNDYACREAVAILKVFAIKQGIHADALTMTDGAEVIDQIAIVLRCEDFPSPPAPPGKEMPPNSDSLRFRHGPDYRDCTWNGKRYTFSTMQAACVQVLWEERDKGTLELSQQYILEKAGSEAERLKDVFKGSEAWTTMIVKGSTHGSYGLATPR